MKKLKPSTLSISLKDPKATEIVEMLTSHKKAFSDWSMYNGKLTMKSHLENKDFSNETFVKIMGLSTTYTLK